MITRTAQYRAKQFNDRMQGKYYPDDDSIIKEILKGGSPVKREDIERDFRANISAKGYEVSADVVTTIVGESLERLKKAGVISGMPKNQRGFWSMP